MNRAENGMASAAKRIGVPLDEYMRRRAAGERWCTGHRAWHPESEFPHRSRSFCREATLGRGDAFRNWLLARVLAK